MVLQQRVAVVPSRVHASVLIFATADIVRILRRLTQHHIPIEARDLQLANLVLGLLHPVRVARGRHEVRGAVGHDEVLSRDEQGDRALQRRVVVHLLQGAARDWQVPQQTLVLRTIVRHHLGKVEIHVITHALSRLFLLTGDTPDDLRLDRARRGKGFHDGLALELHHRLSQDRVAHATGTVPRLSALLDLQPQQVQALLVRLFPVLTCRDVSVVHLHQLAADPRQNVVIEELSQVGTEVFCRRLVRGEADLKAVDANVHLFGVHNLDLKRRFVGHASGSAFRGLVETFVNHLAVLNNKQLVWA